MDVAHFQRSHQIHATQGKQPKGIGVDLAAEHVDHRSEVLARHRPVGAGTVHAKILPAGGEHGDAQFARELEYARIELLVEQAGNQRWITRDAIEQPRSIAQGESRNIQADDIGVRSAALNLGVNLASRHGQVFDRALVGVGAPARQSVVVVDVRQGFPSSSSSAVSG